MKKKDLILISSAIGAGLLSVSTKSNNPTFSNLALLFAGISAYLTTAPRVSHHSRMEDLIIDTVESKKKEGEKEKEKKKEEENKDAKDVKENKQERSS